MNLAIFDIDGTLTATSSVDCECYVSAFKEVFGLEIQNSNWERFTHYTDSGIMAQVFQEAYNRLPSADEHAKIRQEFARRLQQAYKSQPERFPAITGSTSMLQRLAKEPDWKLALATGCWRVSAEFKLNMAGFEGDGIPLSTCDEVIDREAIMQNAVKLAREAYGIKAFDKIVYIGDGIWDVKASRKLGFGFVGIEYENHHQSRLENAGAPVIISDYNDYDLFIELLRTAPTPD